MTNSFTYQDCTLGYVEFGSGRDVILCLPGFGRPAEDFAIFSSLLKTEQRIVALHLFAHEGSSFPESRLEKKPLSKAELASMFSAFLDHLQAKEVNVVAYSMGGRIALTLCETLPSKISSLLLIAPDGLKRNPLYRFATETSVGRKLFIKWADDPGLLFSIANFLNRIGILSDKLNRFVHSNLETRSKRMQVYEAWMTYRKIFPRLRLVGRNIRSRNIRTNLIFGRHDAIIRTHLGRKFVRITGDQKMLHILPMGHRLMNEATVKYIANHHLWPR